MKIDVHAHYVPPSCLDIMDRSGAGPSKNLPDSLSDLGERIGHMDERGVDVQLVSTPPWGGNLSPEASRRANDATAADIDAHRDRLVGLATVDMNEPEAAAAELERCVKELGFRGVEILSNVNGENLHEPRFAPFYRKVQELEVGVFIHPNNVLGRDRLKPFFLNNIVGNPTDTAVAAACLIFGGVLHEMPNLKFVLAHGGGSCPLLRGRWEHAWRTGLIEDTAMVRAPSEYFRKLYFDSLTHSLPALNYLVETVGPERVMLGSDYPFGMGDQRPPATVASLPHASDAEKDSMYGGNAVRVFGLDEALAR
jgi:aminocarboxymuconate-semialdehyde decarboxylase